MDFSMVSNGSFFMVTWIVFKNHLLEIGLNKPRDHGTPKSHNNWFITFYHLWGPRMNRTPWNSIWLRSRSHMIWHYNWGHVTTLQDFGSVWGRPLDTPFGLSQFNGHGCWLMCEVNHDTQCQLLSWMTFSQLVGPWTCQFCTSMNQKYNNKRLSTHMFKFASRLSVQYFWQILGFIFYYLNMSCEVICRECMNF